MLLLLNILGNVCFRFLKDLCEPRLGVTLGIESRSLYLSLLSVAAATVGYSLSAEAIENGPGHHLNNEKGM